MKGDLIMKDIKKLEALAKQISQLDEKEVWYNQGVLAVLSGKYDLMIQKMIVKNSQSCQQPA